MSSATWSLRLRPVCSLAPVAPAISVTRRSIAVWMSSSVGANANVPSMSSSSTRASAAVITWRSCSSSKPTRSSMCTCAGSREVVTREPPVVRQADGDASSSSDGPSPNRPEVGATTRSGLLTTPLRDRFGIIARMEFYTVEELESIILRGARLLAVPMSADGAREIARRSRGTPRVASRLLRRVRDFATVQRADEVDAAVADGALRQLEVDDLGLDSLDRRYLKIIAQNYGGGPVGIDTVAAALSEQRDTLEETIEPFLLQQGLIQRTPRGRMLTRGAFVHLGLTPPPPSALQVDLFEAEAP